MTAARRIAHALVLPMVFLAGLGVLQAQQVTFDRLLHASEEPQNWLTHSGTLGSQRHSMLRQIEIGRAHV